MEHVKDFFITNFPLIIIAIGMICVALYDFKVRKRASSYVLGIIFLALLLAVFLEMEHVGSQTLNIPLTTVFAFFGYTLRPFEMCLFIGLSESKKRKYFLYLLIPLLINVIIYSSALFIGTDFGKFVYYYAVNDAGTKLIHQRGSIFCFSSHFISAGLLAFLMFKSLKKIKSKHSLDGIAILVCSLFVVLAVLIETFTEVSGILNNAIGVSCVFYYLFMYNEINRRDALTGVFDRKTFFADEKRFGGEVKGIIHVDMNGLKLINDEKGHEKGDVAIVTLASVIENNIKKDMYLYRIGGDEFVVLCLKETEEQIKDMIQLLKNKMSETPYSASFGHSMRKDGSDPVEQMLKEAEIEMYEDKNQFYTKNNIERRRK